MNISLEYFDDNNFLRIFLNNNQIKEFFHDGLWTFKLLKQYGRPPGQSGRRRKRQAPPPGEGPRGPGVNFINILLTDFTHPDPKKSKKRLTT